jgi:glycosyltransferase involved in cell wall biosynthesis
VHLFAIGPVRVEMPRELASSIASVNFLNDAAFGGWDGESIYQGTSLPAARNNPRATNRILAALAWLDAVVNCHSGEFNTAAADLRRLGVRTVSHIHLLDMSPYGRSVGHPMIALAYEYAYDLIVSNSHQLTSWMHGAGIPSEKLLYVRNAPGYPLDPAARDRILEQRASTLNRGLKVLYIGRLDRQKGIDRLAEVVQRTVDLGLSTDWRVVGSPVTGDCPIPSVIEDLLEPAVFDSDELTALYAWADVMVLLSDYEGVPLSILEAQRLGTVVIATNVGALGEIIDSGRTGFLVERETAVEETVSLLTFLMEVPAFRSRIAAAASQVVEWREAAAEFVERLTTLVKTGRQTGDSVNLSQRIDDTDIGSVAEPRAGSV